MPDPVAFSSHDHAQCEKTALAKAEAHCREHKLRLTPVRRAALEILLSEHRALGAYEVLEKLAAAGHGSHPPAAYRALSFLTDAGLAHKVEALNAYVACSHSGNSHTPVFLVCTSCNNVAEAEMNSHGLDSAAHASGFEIKRSVIEATGLCPGCQ
ncbi:MAG: Fur family transcriptional regulator [Pseudomonadota bacterium]